WNRLALLRVALRHLNGCRRANPLSLGRDASARRTLPLPPVAEPRAARATSVRPTPNSRAASVAAMTDHPPESDLPYLERHFVELDRLAAAHGWDLAVLRAEIAAERMPQPTYRLADGRELVPPDYFTLAEAAGSSAQLPGWFASAYRVAARDEPDADPLQTAWSDYLSGDYGVCLRVVTPATIVRKEALVVQPERLPADPKPS